MPLFGYGVGTTDLWSETLPTHNTYLKLGVDFGVAGLLLLPLLVLATVKDARGAAARLRPAFLVFVLLWGLFDHNVVNTYYFAVAFALMAAMADLVPHGADDRTWDGSDQYASVSSRAPPRGVA